MVETPKHVRGVDLVLNAFGYWPSFHDARIEGVRLDKSGGGAVMEAPGSKPRAPRGETSRNAVNPLDSEKVSTTARDENGAAETGATG